MAATRPCPPGCSEHGTCNLVRGTCDCPLTRTGDDCLQLALPACSIDGLALRPTALVHDWETKLRAASWLGPLTCACWRQILARRHLLQFRNAYVARPKYRVTCARLPGGADAQMVGALLSQPEAANWTSLLVTFRGSTTVHMAKRPPPGRGSWSPRPCSSCRPSSYSCSPRAFFSCSLSFHP